ncbi:MAG: bifunctional DNA primase/polymerase [Phycisphaerales bacterium]|nr:bifunctional DNA primase/polymerase [Planctomycetota bacterium]MCH8508683.1 bifunctional DNA primase/polymerase [Phycisphaerales bacterium]
MITTHEVTEAARGYLARGFQPTPISAREKRPLLDAWQKTILSADELEEHFRPGLNIGLMLGDPSGGLVDVDLDCPEACELAAKYLPPTPAITGRESAPRSHWWYIAPGSTTKRYQMPGTREVVCEIRSTGAQTLVGPSIHPSGERYADLDGTPATVPAEMLATCVAGLAAAVARARGIDPEQQRRPDPRPASPPPAASGADPAHEERRALAYLDRMPGAIAGAGGHSATFAAASAMVHGFGLPAGTALSILEERYNPRCAPPWSRRELEHKVQQAATVRHERPYRWLADSEAPEDADAALVDLRFFEIGIAGEEPPPAVPALEDPGPLPPELFEVPGLIGDLMRHNLATAFRPQPALALGAAICLQAVLAGRKVRDDGNTRTNIYAIGVAPSGSGKDHARKINSQALILGGADPLFGPEELASDSGLVAVLSKSPAVLFQLDEFGRMLRAIAAARGAAHLEGIVTTLLKLYSSAGGVWKSKGYADPDKNKVIDQPNAVLWGTTVQSHLLESLTLEQMTDGFVARLLIFEGEALPQRNKCAAQDLPASIIEAVQWWAQFKPGGNLANEHPRPITVETDDGARSVFDAFADECDGRRRGGEESVSALWARAEEKAIKLALIYACSRDRENPVIDADAAGWAVALVRHIHRRMLFLADQHVAESDFEARQKRVLRFLNERKNAGNPWASLTEMTTKLRSLDSRQRDEVLRILVDRALVQRRTRNPQPRGRPITEYALVGWAERG